MVGVRGEVVGDEWKRGGESEVVDDEREREVRGGGSEWVPWGMSGVSEGVGQ